MKAATALLAGLLVTVAGVAVQGPGGGQALAGDERPPAGIAVPRFGPGVAGHVVAGPTAPVCQPGIPCTRPLAGASVHILDGNPGAPGGRVVARAVTNSQGNFLVSVPAGVYVVRVGTPEVLPACHDVEVTVGVKRFTRVTVECDTGMR